MLVCHPRKTKPGETFTSEDVAGSANITNLADTVINIEKPNLRVTKNREYGICERIQCSYDPATRRIFQTAYGDRIIYGWNHNDLPLAVNPVSSFPDFTIRDGQPVATERQQAAPPF